MPVVDATATEQRAREIPLGGPLAWPDHPDWMRAFIALLAERAPVDTAKESVASA